MLPFPEWIFETGFTPDFPMELPDRVSLRTVTPTIQQLLQPS